MASQGDENLNDLYIQVGFAATTWETVDLSMANIFGAFLDGAPYFGPERVYGLLISAPAKMEAIKAAANVAFHWKSVPSNEEAHFSLLMKHYKDASSRRNEIVHSMAVR